MNSKARVMPKIFFTPGLHRILNSELIDSVVDNGNWNFLKIFTCWFFDLIRKAVEIEKVWKMTSSITVFPNFAYSQTTSQILLYPCTTPTTIYLVFLFNLILNLLTFYLALTQAWYTWNHGLDVLVVFFPKKILKINTWKIKLKLQWNTTHIARKGRIKTIDFRTTKSLRCYWWEYKMVPPF